MKETQQNVEEAESKASVQIIHHEQEICKWPTETFAIDHYHYREDEDEDEDDNPNSDPELLEPTIIYPHTVLMFVPGNPGCAGWYISMLKTIIEKLGRGYSCRAVSYAGHGTLPHLVRGKRNHLDHESKNVNMNMNIAWSVDGQVEHKVQWVDMITREFVSRRSRSSSKRSNIHSHSHSHSRRIPRYIFISHSIGSHLVQRMCVLREDILLQTQALIHLMPFIRFDPSPKWKGKLLSAFGNMPNLSIPMLKSASRVAAKVPERVLDAYLEHVAGVGLDEDRKLAKGLMTNHDYTENFLRLGLEEIRDVPQTTEVSALRLIGRVCPSYMYYCGYGTTMDQWAPKFHMEELEQYKADGVVPQNIHLEYNDNLVHAFIVSPPMIDPVVDFIIRSIGSSGSGIGGRAVDRQTQIEAEESSSLRSKL